MKARFRAYLLVGVIALIFVGAFAGVPSASADCEECKAKYFDGGGFMDPWLFVYCGLANGAGYHECIVDDATQDCYEYLSCADIIIA